MGIVTLLFGIAILIFNFGNEYFALEGKVPLRELPSAASAMKRTGLDKDSSALGLTPQVFWPSQFYRVTMTMLPFAVNILTVKTAPVPSYRYRDYLAVGIGVLALVFCLAALAVIWIRRQPGMAALLATLTVSGFCYAVMLRHSVAYHHFESVFYIGMPLAAYTLGLLCLWRMSRARLSPLFAIAALSMFVLSVSEISGLGQSREELAVEAEEMAEYGPIRDLVDARATIYVPLPYLDFSRAAPWGWAYYLSGENVIFNEGRGPLNPPQAGDYLMLPTRKDTKALLTPEHRHIFLYDWALYDEWLRTVDWGHPIIAGAGWQVYLGDGYLMYVSPECAHRDELFLLHFIARNTADLRSDWQEYGYANADFDFQRFGITLSDGTCVVERPLPEYDIIAIRTGQYNGAGRIWGGEYRLPSH